MNLDAIRRRAIDGTATLRIPAGALDGLPAVHEETL